MPDGEHDAGVAAGRGRRPAARRGERERLLDEDMPAGPGRGGDLFGVQRMRRGDQHGVDRRIGQRVGENRTGGAAEVLREGRALPGVGRDAGDEIEAGDMAGGARQFAAPPAQPDNGNPDSHGFLPPRPVSPARFPGSVFRFPVRFPAPGRCIMAAGAG